MYYIVIYFGIILASFILWWKFLKVFYDWVFQIISQRFTLSNYEICLLKPINAQNILQKYFEVVLIYLTFTIWFVSVKKLEEERKRLELLIEEHQSYNGKKQKAQLTYTCSKSTIETLKKVWNMFQLNHSGHWGINPPSLAKPPP